MLDRIIHKWLKLPYRLYVRYNRRPKRARETIIFIHGIGNSGAAWEAVIAKLPADIRIITVDLLGFGESPRPKWAKYSVSTQARALLATLATLVIPGKVTLVGHSLGALVAIEAAKCYPLVVKRLILCSPPIYKNDVRRRLPQSDVMLRSLYQATINHPEEFVKIVAFATRYKLVNNTFNVTSENADTYMATLEAAILDQTSYEDVSAMNIQTIIVRGTLDPFVIGGNLKAIAKQNPNVILKSVFAGHEVQNRFVDAVVDTINLSHRT